MASPPESSPDLSRMISTSLTSLTIGDHLQLPSKLMLSCFHDAGDERIRAQLGKPMEEDIMDLYKEAVSRLPISEMPEILDCVIRGGHCVGLLDPVSNIILNSLNLLCRRKCGGGSGRSRRNGKARPCVSGKRKEVVEKAPSTKASWVSIAYSSYTGLIAFMRTYFRYLSRGQAMRYLRLAGADLTVAVKLGEHQQLGPEDVNAAGAPDLCCGRTQFALQVAAAVAGHPFPKDLAWLAKSLTPLKDHKSLAVVLQKGQALGVDDVNGILNSLRCLHYEASPAVHVTFRRTPEPTDMDIGVLEAGRRPAEFSCVVGENHVAKVVISRYEGPVSSICDLRTPMEVNQMLCNCLDVAATTIRECSSLHVTMDRIRMTAAPSTECECEHIRYLRMCLTDIFHAFYIKAVSMLPHKALHKHLRGILVAGHCYGPMDPVSNIILNAIWYDSVFPQLEMDVELEPDILDSQSMLRMEVRSLDGLVAMFCAATGFSQHKALEYLCYKQCDLSAVLQMATKEICSNAYDCAGQAGKHPKHLELASFLVSIARNDLQDLRSLLINKTMTKCYVISDASLERVCKIIEDRSSSKFTEPSVDHPRLFPTALKMLASRKDVFVKQQNFLRQALEELLLDYSNKHPWEPVPSLHVICGMKSQGHSKCYHVNFLAYYDGVASACTLFFAELWESSFQAKRSEPSSSVANVLPVPCNANGRQTGSSAQFIKVYSKSSRKESEISFCCPLPYYSADHPYLGRCSFCEPSLSKIVHPPCGKHTGANYGRLGDSLDYLNMRENLASAMDGGRRNNYSTMEEPALDRAKIEIAAAG